MGLFDGRRVAELEAQNATLLQVAGELRTHAAEVELERRNLRLALDEVEAERDELREKSVELERQNEILVRLAGPVASKAADPMTFITVNEAGQWRTKTWREMGIDLDEPEGVTPDEWRPAPKERLVRGRKYPDWSRGLEAMHQNGEIDAALQIAFECIEASEVGEGRAAPWFVRFAVGLLREERAYGQALDLIERWLARSSLGEPAGYAKIAQMIRLHAAVTKDKKVVDGREVGSQN